MRARAEIFAVIVASRGNLSADYKQRGMNKVERMKTRRIMQIH